MSISSAGRIDVRSRNAPAAASRRWRSTTGQAERARLGDAGRLRGGHRAARRGRCACAPWSSPAPASGRSSAAPTSARWPRSRGRTRRAPSSPACTPACAAVRACPVPVIARIQGYCFGARAGAGGGLRPADRRGDRRLRHAGGAARHPLGGRGGAAADADRLGPHPPAAAAPARPSTRRPRWPGAWSRRWRRLASWTPRSTPASPTSSPAAPSPIRQQKALIQAWETLPLADADRGRGRDLRRRLPHRRADPDDGRLPRGAGGAEGADGRRFRCFPCSGKGPIH